MKAYVSLIILTSLSFFASAQNYDPLSKEFTYQYINSTADTIHSLKIDSIAVNGQDSTFFFNPRVELNSNDFIYPVDSNNVVGQYLIKSTNREYIFVNSEKDSFLLMLNTPLDQSWTFNGERNLTASITARLIESFAGTSDSVMTISLSNGSEIKISKKYGIIQAPDLNLITANYSKMFTLDAIPEAGIGVFKSTASFYFNFQPGDQFGYESNTTYASYECSWEKIWRKVLSKEETENSIIYEVFQIQERYSNSSPDNPFCTGSSYHYTVKDTIEISVINGIYSDPLFESLGFGLPDTFLLPFEGEKSPAHYAPFVNAGLSKEENKWKNHLTMLEYNDGAYQQILNFGYHVAMEEGIGITSAITSMSNNYTTLSMTCASTATYSFGDCDELGVILNSKPALATAYISVFPNPAGRSLTFELPGSNEELIFRVISITGTEVEEKIIPAGLEVVESDISQLPSGLYLINVSGTNVLYSGTFIKD